MQAEPRTNENPLLIPGASIACFSMVMLLLAHSDGSGVALTAVLLAAGNLLLMNLKYFKLLKRHNRILSLVRLRERLAAQKTDQIGP